MKFISRSPVFTALLCFALMPTFAQQPKSDVSAKAAASKSSAGASGQKDQMVQIGMSEPDVARLWGPPDIVNQTYVLAPDRSKRPVTQWIYKKSGSAEIYAEVDFSKGVVSAVRINGRQ